MTCLTVTEAAAEYAAETSVDLIISHHPLIFAPLKRVTLDNSVGRIIYSLVTHRISLFVGHTNIDRAEGGLNDWLAESLHLLDVGVLEPELDESGYGRIGRLQSKMTLASLAKYVGEVLGIQGRNSGPNVGWCRQWQQKRRITFVAGSPSTGCRCPDYRRCEIYVLDVGTCGHD